MSAVGRTTPTPWLRGRLALVAGPDDRPRTCRHAGGDVRGTWLLLWQPWELQCALCAQQAALTARGGGVEDRTCDVCRSTGDTAVTTVALRLAAGVTVVGGACDACRSILVGDVRPVAS